MSILLLQQREPLTLFFAEEATGKKTKPMPLSSAKGAELFSTGPTRKTTSSVGPTLKTKPLPPCLHLTPHACSSKLADQEDQEVILQLF